jgi:hypothetical protein
MTGTFTTAEQARGDQNFRDVTLHVTSIWSDRTDGTWLYAEQALTDGLDHPYRQLVYQVTAGIEGRFEIHLFELPDRSTTMTLAPSMTVIPPHGKRDDSYDE